MHDSTAVRSRCTHTHTHVHREQERRAARLAAEIESAPTQNIHLAQERNQVCVCVCIYVCVLNATKAASVAPYNLHPHAQRVKNVTEEDMFGAVLRGNGKMGKGDTSPKTIAKRGDNAYVPPQARRSMEDSSGKVMPKGGSNSPSTPASANSAPAAPTAGGKAQAAATAAAPAPAAAAAPAPAPHRTWAQRTGPGIKRSNKASNMARVNEIGVRLTAGGERAV